MGTSRVTVVPALGVLAAVKPATDAGAGVQPPEEAEPAEPVPLVANVDEDLLVSQAAGSAQRVARVAEQAEFTV